ncbi:ionotropic receptor 93a-like [Haemaphysalis longicornis]
MFVASASGSVRGSDHTLRVTVPHVTPYITRTPVPGGMILQGPIATLLETISRATKMKLLIVNKNETTWGFKATSGSTTGFTGLIARGVWFGLLFCMLTMSSLVALDSSVALNNLNGFFKRLGKSLWICYTYFFTSANNPGVTRVSTRILLGTWSLFLFILLTLLSSRLVSTMLIKGTEDHVDTIGDVLRFPKLKVLVERKTFFEDFLMKPKSVFFMKLQRQVELVAGSIRPGPVQDEVFDRVERGGHVVLYDRFFQDATLARRFAQRGKCSFRRASQALYLQPVAMLMRKTMNATVKRTIKIQLRRSFEMALQVRPMEPYISNASRCYIEEHEQAAAYRIEDMQGAFLTLALGLMLAVGVFAIELAANRARPREIRNRTARKRIFRN